MTAPVITYDLEIIENEFQANTFETGDQLTPDLLGLSNGGYVVAYNSGSGPGHDIRLDFYDANGQVVAGAVDPGGGTPAAEPSLAQLDNGNVLIIWDDNGAAHLGTKGAIYSPTGQLLVPEFSITSSVGDYDPQVTALEHGGFAVSYTNTVGEIQFKVFDDSGVFQNAGGFDIAPGTQSTEPAITALEDGGFVVTWTEYNPSTAIYEIVARIFNENGTSRPVNGSTAPFTVGTTGDNKEPSITALPNGNFAVAYTDSGWNNEDTGITLTIVGPDGAIVNPYVHVNTPSDPGNESDPDITVLVNGFIVVSWTDPASDSDILCRIFNEDGTPIDLFGGTPINLSVSPTVDIESAVSGILAGQFIAAWQDNATDGDGGQISAVVTELVRHTDGTSGADTLIGDELRDVINGEAGDDTLIGGGGKDTLDGGTNVDTADYSDKTASVAVTLNGANFVTVSVGGLAEDTIKNIENVTGGSAADTLTGDNLANALSGGGNADLLSGGNGNDTLKGGLGNDTLNGGGNTDTADYRDKASAINVTLDGGHYVSVTVGGVAEDSIKNIENVYGGTNNDRITGDAGDNFLYGYSGDDVLKGGLGADQLDGYTGLDTADYRDKTASVAVTLDGSNFVTVSVGGVAEDSIRRVERVYGGSAADTLVGDAAANLFCGGGGNDALTGNGASDIFLFNTTLNAATNLDHLTDFTTLDEIDLDDAVFTALSGGTLAATAFYSAAGATSAHDADDRIVYNSTNGALYYDADGNKAGGVAPIEFAVVDTHAALTNADFVVV